MKYKRGDIIKVGPAYVGAGQYQHDGWTGTFTVVGTIGGPGGPDYKLVRGVDPEAEEHEWQVITHESRVPGVAP